MSYIWSVAFSLNQVAVTMSTVYFLEIDNISKVNMKLSFLFSMFSNFH